VRGKAVCHRASRTSRPDQQTFALVAQVRQCRAIDPLRAQHVDVVLLDELIRGEGFGRAKHHVPGIMDDDIEAAGVLQDMRNARLGRAVRLDIQFDGAEV
jgi:hypothetical protein